MKNEHITDAFYKNMFVYRWGKYLENNRLKYHFMHNFRLIIRKFKMLERYFFRNSYNLRVNKIINLYVIFVVIF